MLQCIHYSKKLLTIFYPITIPSAFWPSFHLNTTDSTFWPNFYPKSIHYGFRLIFHPNIIHFNFGPFFYLEHFVLVIDLYHSAAMLSLKSLVFAQQSSPRPEFSVRLAVQKHIFLFSLDSTWPLCDKSLLNG